MLIFHRENPTKIPQPKASLMQDQHVVAMALLWKERGNQRGEKEDVSEEQVHATE